MKWHEVLVLAVCVLTVTSCALLENLGHVAADPAVQETVGGVAGAVATGNWPAALYKLGELSVVGYGAWKTANITRDRRRKQRGEQA